MIGCTKAKEGNGAEMRNPWAVLSILALLSACGGEENTGAVRDAYVLSLLDAGDLPRNRRDTSIRPDAGVSLRDQGVPRDVQIVDVAIRDASNTERDLSANDAGPVEQEDAAVPPDPDPLSEIGVDTDGDGLDDAWERGAANEQLLDWQSRDTDGDGITDDREDFDEDGLTAAQEQAAGRMVSMTASHRPHPFKRDLLIELDTMEGRIVAPEVLQIVVDAYDALGSEGVDGHRGVAIHFFGDQFDLEVQEFDQNFEPRQRLLAGAGPVFGDAPDDFPMSEMIHVVIASRRRDLDTRGGEVITHADDIDRTGVLIYADTIATVFPRCGLDDPPPVPFVTVDEAMAGTLVHEIGHTLQLGHDTAVGGGVNPWNIMSVPSGCVPTRQRAHGEGNEDPVRGNTEAASAPRFSLEAAALMNFTNKLSVETSELVDGDDGREM